MNDIKSKIIGELGKNITKTNSDIYSNDKEVTEKTNNKGFDFGKAFQEMAKKKEKEIVLTENQQKQKQRTIKQLASSQSGLLEQLLNHR